MVIGKGTSLKIPVQIILNDEVLDPSMVTKAEFLINGIRKVFNTESDLDVQYDDENREFHVWLTQSETMTLHPDMFNRIRMDIRFKIANGSTLKIQDPIYFTFSDGQGGEEIL